MAEAKSTTRKPVGKNSDAFLETFDKNTYLPRKIREGLTQLGESWLPELEFMRLAQVSSTDLALVREQFEDYFVVVKQDGRSGKRIWFGDLKLASEMRKKVS